MAVLKLDDLKRRHERHKRKNKAAGVLVGSDGGQAGGGQHRLRTLPGMKLTLWGGGNNSGNFTLRGLGQQSENVASLAGRIRTSTEQAAKGLRMLSPSR